MRNNRIENREKICKSYFPVNIWLFTAKSATPTTSIMSCRAVLWCNLIISRIDFSDTTEPCFLSFQPTHFNILFSMQEPIFISFLWILLLYCCRCFRRCYLLLNFCYLSLYNLLLYNSNKLRYYIVGTTTCLLLRHNMYL